MFKTSFRLPDALRSSLGVFFAAFLAVALVIGGQSLVLNTPVANAATNEISVSPKEHTYNRVSARPMDTLEFTIEEDATINELDFKLEGTGWLQEYNLWVNGKELSPKITRSGAPQKAPLVEHNNLNIEVKKGDKVELKLRYTAPTVSGSVALTLRGILPEPEQPSEPEVTSEPETEAPTEEPSVEPTTDPESEKPEDKPTVGPEPTTTEETTSKPTETPVPSVTSPQPSAAEVTPAAPEFVDPSTSEKCEEKGYVTLPETEGVDYYLNSVKKAAGLHVYEQTKPGKVQITAKAQDGFVLASDATTQWDFEFSGEVKNCSTKPDQPVDEGEKVREFTATGHDFALNADEVDTTRPNTFTAVVGEDIKFTRATVRIKTNATFLDPQYYRLTIDQMEDGVTLERQNVHIGNGYIEMDAVPVKNGQPYESNIPKDAVFTFTNSLSQNKNLKVTLDVYGKKIEKNEPEIITPPDGADWVHPRVANPQLPEQCGLRVAVVADMSRSLQYADTNGFEQSRLAANALIDALAGTPVELGVYNFATTAPQVPAGSTYGGNPPYESMESEAGVAKVKQAVANWDRVSADSTNWEAGLQQVEDGDYDIVYFITDGMPTYSSKSRPLGINGEFVQASALNAAIDAANELKKNGTRIVPIMVDLTLGGNGAERHTVTQDYVLKDIAPLPGHLDKGGYYYQIQSADQGPQTSKYISEKDSITVNFEIAVNGGGLKVFKSVKAPQGFYTEKEATQDKNGYTYGPRGVKVMGEDISGTGDTIRVEQYSLLAEKMGELGNQIANNCRGIVTVKKNIVDKNGKILEDGAPGWDFTLTANDAVIDSEYGADRRTSMKSTSGSKSSWGTASWRINSDEEQVLKLEETQQTGFNLFKTDSKNAVCTQEIDGETKPLEVTNDGDLGFKVKMAKSGMGLASVSCVVSNYEEKDSPKGELTFKKAQYGANGEEVLGDLGGAAFEIYAASNNEPDFEGGPVYSIEPGKTSVEIDKTGTFFLVETKAPDGLNLLPKPVPFNITMENGEFKVSVVGENNPFLKAEGTGNDMVLTVTDTLSGELPKSGGRGFLMWALFGLLMTVGGFFWTRRRAVA